MRCWRKRWNTYGTHKVLQVQGSTQKQQRTSYQTWVMYELKTCGKQKQVLHKYVLFSNKLACNIYIYIYSTVPRALWINNFTIFAFGSPLCYMAAVKLKKLLQNSPSFYQTIPERSPSHPCMGQWLSPTEMTETVRLSCAVGTLSCPSCHGVSASPSLCQFVGLERGVSSDQSPTVCNKKLYELPVSIIQQRLRFYQRFFRNAGLLRCDVLLVNSCISFE